MQALINAPSKILANVHGKKKAFPSSSKVSSAIPWTCEICLSKSAHRSCHGLLYANSPHREGIHSLPLSNSQVGLGIETVKTEVLQTDGPNVACLRLQLEIECQYGEHFLVVGNDPVLGSWNPSNAIPLSWSDGHIWTVDLELPVRKTIQYKFIWKLGTGDIMWQPGPNRIVRLGEGQNVLIVGEDWENPDAQRIFVKQQENQKIKASAPPVELSNPDKKFKVRGSKNCFNVSESANAANNAEATSVAHTNKQHSGARDPECVNKELLARGSNDEAASNNKNLVDTDDEGESLVIYDEGHVLGPGLITEEALTKELKNSIVASSSDIDETPTDENRLEDEGESLVNYDEGHVLVPGLTAQMITEEALAEELQKSILANSLNGEALAD